MSTSSIFLSFQLCPDQVPPVMANTQRIPALFSHISPKPRSSPYVCQNCRQQLRRVRSPNSHQLRHATTPFTEKLRRKIWGTDNPPGLKDPYGPGWAERRAAVKAQQEPGQTKAADVDEREWMAGGRPNLVDRDFDDKFEDDPVSFKDDLGQDENYKPAETWDGLQHVGHRGSWEDMPPLLGDEYVP